MRLRSAIAAIGVLLISTAQLAAADLFTTEQAPAPPPDEHGIWAAIAYSAPDEKYGFFWGADKRQEAMDIALKHCERDKGRSCVVVSIFRNHRHWDDDDKTGFPYNHCIIAVRLPSARKAAAGRRPGVRTRRQRAAKRRIWHSRHVSARAPAAGRF